MVPGMPTSGPDHLRHVPRSLRPGLALALVFALACGDEDEPRVDGGSPPADAGVPDDAGEVDAGEVDAGEMDAGEMDAGEEEIDPSEEPFAVLRGFEGSSAARYDLVFIGDGYTVEQLNDVYDQHVDHVTARIFTRRNNGATEPFRALRDLFNVVKLYVPSPESGIDEGGETRETALDGTEVCASLGGICFVDPAKVRTAVASALEGSAFEPDLVIVTLNTAQPLEGVIEDEDGKIAVYGGGPTDGDDFMTSERGLRQIARAMADLALTTPGAGAYTGEEPSAANLSTDGTGAKWQAWLGFDAPHDEQAAVNAYEGGGGFGTGIFRPVSASKLTGDYPAPFDPVAREAIFLAVFDTVGVFDEVASTSEASSLSNPTAIDAIPTSNALTTIEWRVDGEVTEITDSRFGFTGWAMANGLAAGPHTVEARATVETQFRFPNCRGCDFTVEDFVRQGSERLEATRSWNVVFTP